MKNKTRDAGEKPRSIAQMQDFLIPMGIGAVIACVSMIPILVGEGPSRPAYVSVPLGAIGLLAMPGVILSLVLTGSTHDPKLVLATVVNFVLYAALFSWLRTYRRRKQASRVD
jgi:hypothetical protein